MAQPFKVHELLKDHGEDLAELEAYARDPGRTIDECHTWLLAKGYVLSRSAVGTWKQSFDALLMQERFSRSSELARAIKGAVSGGDFEAVADAAAMQLTQVVFEQAAKLEQDGELDPLDVQRMTRSLANLVGSQLGLKKLLAEKFDERIAALQKRHPDGQIPPEEIAAARRDIFGC